MAQILLILENVYKFIHVTVCHGQELTDIVIVDN